MDKNILKGGLKIAGIGGGIALCSELLCSLLNRRIIKPKTAQSETDYTMACGALAGMGGTILGAGLAIIVSEVFDKEVV